MPVHQDIELAIRKHIEMTWPGRSIESFSWALGPIKESITDFKVLRVAPTTPKESWVYVSCGAWQAETRETNRYEFFLLSPIESPSHVETLAMLANFHSTNEFNVEPAKVIDIGRPWMDNATCDKLLISIPYPIGPNREFFRVPDTSLSIRLLWLMPITSDEAEFAKSNGVEELERMLEERHVNCLDRNRASVLTQS